MVLKRLVEATWITTLWLCVTNKIVVMTISIYQKQQQQQKDPKQYFLEERRR